MQKHIQTQYDQLKKTVLQLSGNEAFYFPSDIIVKETPTGSIRLWAVSISPDQHIYLMDNSSNWHKLEERDSYFPLVVSTLFQRLTHTALQELKKNSIMYTVNREIIIPSYCKEQAIVVQTNYSLTKEINFYVFADEETVKKLESPSDVAIFKVKNKTA